MACLIYQRPKIDDNIIPFDVVEVRVVIIVIGWWFGLRWRVVATPAGGVAATVVDCRPVATGVGAVITNCASITTGPVTASGTGEILATIVDSCHIVAGANYRPNLALCWRYRRQLRLR